MPKEVLVPTADASVYLRTLTDQEDLALHRASQTDNPDLNAASEGMSFTHRRMMLALHPEILALGIWAHEQLAGELDVWPVSREPRVAELGYRVLPSFRRNGYATLAVQAAAEYTIGEYGMEDVLAQTRLSNHTSQGVLERAGFIQFMVGDGILNYVYGQNQEIVQALAIEEVRDAALTRLVEASL